MALRYVNMLLQAAFHMQSPRMVFWSLDFHEESAFMAPYGQNSTELTTLSADLFAGHLQ